MAQINIDNGVALINAAPGDTLVYDGVTYLYELRSYGFVWNGGAKGGYVQQFSPRPGRPQPSWIEAETRVGRWWRKPHGTTGDFKLALALTKAKALVDYHNAKELVTKYESEV